MIWEKFSHYVTKLDSAIGRLPVQQHFCAGSGSTTPGTLGDCSNSSCRWLFSAQMTPAFDSADTNGDL